MKKSKLWNFIAKFFALSLVGALLVLPSCKEDEPAPAPAEPTASFQFEIDAADFFKVNFTNFSQNATIYAWDFGDGAGTSTDKDVSYTYSAAGTYTVTLTASDAEGNSSEKSEDITITDPDEALTLLAGSVSKDWKLLREGVSMGIGPNYDDFASWFSLTNDGSRNCLYDDTFTFTRAGGYEFNDAGTMWGEGGIYTPESDKGSLLETCFEATVANMTIDGNDKSAWLSSTAHAYDYDVANNKITLTGNGAWIGLIKCGTEGDVNEPQESTTFDAKLTSGGESGVDTLDVWFEYGLWRFRYVSYANPADEPVLPADLVEPSFTFEVADKTVTFTNTSKNAETYSWDFGDETGTSTEASPVYVYANDGTYSVVLTATGNGQTETFSADVSIGGPPFAEGAPAPTEPEANVISIYSDAYTPITGVNTNPDWSQATVTTEEMVGEDNVLKMAGLNYQGIDFDANRQDVSSKTMVHVDIWTEDVVVTNFSLIWAAGEAPKELTTVAGQWNSFDISLADFAGDMTTIRQLKFDAADSPTIYVDNIYFY